MRNHRKVKALRQNFTNGYSFWCMFLEFLTGSDGNVFENSEIEKEMLSGDFGISVTEISSMINFCIKIELLFEKDGFIYSESLNDRLAPVYLKRGVARDLSSKQKRNNGKFDSKNTGALGKSVTEKPHSKVNESKIKYKEQFEIFRLKYEGVKRGLETEFEEFTKKHKDWENVIELLLPALENQITVRTLKKEKSEFVPEWKNLKTWLNQRCWEEICVVEQKQKPHKQTQADMNRIYTQ